MNIGLAIRELREEDCLVKITDLIRAAYAKRASEELRFWGTYQTVDDTAKRFRSGRGIIAEIGDHLVGTITVNPPRPESEIPQYRNPTTWHFCQFAVSPDWQGHGIGRRLHDAAVDYAFANGAQTMALDTAAPATGLVDMYSRWGYKKVGEWDWRPQTNYLSVVMARSILPEQT
jgi:GNAT superfamily N-acetyltransferase